MTRRTSRLLAVSTIVGIFGVGLVSAAVDSVSRLDAARLQAKIDRINKNGGSSPGAPLRTAVSEVELNSYLRYELGDKLPAGVTDPWVSILGDGHLSGRATVDMSQVGKGLLGGTLPVVANGVFRTKNGVGTFALASASISGVPVPVWMLQEIVTYYSRSSSAPQGVSIDKPFPLPAGIREIQIDRGQATIVQ
jgi:hypothetical protein